jgi:hypothetical protein
MRFRQRLAAIEVKLGRSTSTPTNNNDIDKKYLVEANGVARADININNKTADKHQQQQQQQHCTFRWPFLASVILAMSILLTVWCISVINITPTINNHRSYRPPNNTTNALLAAYEKIMSNEEVIFSPGRNSLVALMLTDNNKIFCRRSHKKKLLNSDRTLAVIQMLRKGLQNKSDNSGGSGGAFPILLIESDPNGCEGEGTNDHLGFPRLTWSTPSSNKNNWCAAIGMVSYESWSVFRTKTIPTSSWFSLQNWYSRDWDRTFQYQQRTYPWSTKINKAVWRGSTTGHSLEANITNLPRGRLVRHGMERPDLIDAGFTSFVQYFASMKEELLSKNLTITAKQMQFDDQMNYRAILDIDGNSWSSRFPKILCTNSVAIKVVPKWVEYFYDQIQPMEHYIPASLDNLTEVVEYVMDKSNENEMKKIVKAANLWCQRTNTKDQLPRDMVTQLFKYVMTVQELYNNTDWQQEWESVKARTFRYSDLVECV